MRRYWDSRTTGRKLVKVLLAIFGLVLWAGAAAATPAGTVIGVRGLCTDHGHVLNRGDAVQISDTLNVMAGGNLKLQMAEGSVISVAGGSSITVASYESAGSSRAVKVALTQGLLRITSGTRPFEVSTAFGTAAVGSDFTDWFIKAEPDSAQVGVLSGIVDLTSNPTEESVSIPAHWGTRLEVNRAPVPPRVWSQSEFNGFIRLTE
ncbi:MAG: FecR domain-containing protein [Acidobacteria bacterium]|nr:FecR domain-containing protein [Acidobacteriota bacterium]MBV8891367.1 FecR domain-containing protein [Acidobacteriota bacterium]